MTARSRAGRDGWGPLESDLEEDRRAAGRAMGAKGPAGIAFHTLVEAGMVLAVAVGASLLLGARVDPAVFAALSLMAVRFADPPRLWGW